MTGQSLADAMTEGQRLDDLGRWRKSQKPNTDNYTGDDCPRCGRNRLYECNDDRIRCEKCSYESAKSHELKLNDDMFEAVASGDKKFELRKNDRDFREGDTLILRKWKKHGQFYMDVPEITKYVSYVLANYPGIERNYVIMSLEDVPDVHETVI